MDIRTLSATTAIITTLSVCASLSLAARADNFHPGRVLERSSDAPVSADVKAWAPDQRSNASGCPEYGSSPIDAKISDSSSGDFGLAVPREVRTYHVVYCANGFHNKVDRNQPNEDDGSFVIPMPAKLRAQEGQSEAAAIENDTVRLAVYALNELAYLYEVNPEAFQSALADYSSIVSEQDGSAGEVLGVLPELIVQWASSP